MPISSRELAEMQGVSVSFVAKLLPRLERAGIVQSVGGISGGYRLRRPAAEITVLSVIDAVEGRKPLFDCQNVRSRCILFGGRPPDWSTDGMCSIHAVMQKAEAMLREELSRTTLADLAGRANSTPGFTQEARRWFSTRSAARETARLAAIRDSRARALRGSADADRVVDPDPKQKPPRPEEDP